MIIVVEHLKKFVCFNLDTINFEMSFGKLFVWNMTQYDTVLWLDSDTVVANSLHTIFAKADK